MGLAASKFHGSDLRIIYAPKTRLFFLIFQYVASEAGVLHASNGKKRVPYSLRHTYATMRIAEGVSVFQLAANMGTSVEMLEDFYGKKRMRDPKMATEVTKDRRWEKIG
jgi:integrase